MNKNYASLLLLIIAFLFLTAKLAWLGLVMIILAIYVFLSKKINEERKQIWEEFSSAQTNDLTKTMRGYASNASKLAAEHITRKEGTKYQLTSPQAIQKGSKTFIDELKKIFN